MRDVDLDSILDSCLDKVRRQLETLKPIFPRFPHMAAASDLGWSTSGDEEWELLGDGYWTSGFWVGILLLAHRLTGENEFREWGRKWLDALHPRAQSDAIHDLGFVFYPSAALGAELDGDRGMEDLALTAAAGLRRRYSSVYRAITLVNRPPLDRTIAIDTMMNLPLLWWRGMKEGDTAAFEAARNHVETTAAFLIRDDGSTNHVVRFTEGRRVVEAVESWQGHAPGSCWSRGQAWAIAGLVYAWLYSRDESYLRLVEKTIDYFESRLPTGAIPSWDLEGPQGADEPVDASALAIVAHALLSAPDLVDCHGRSHVWISALADRGLAPPDRPGLLSPVCFHRPAEQNVECSAVFADFYFLSALALATKRMDRLYTFAPGHRFN